MDNAYNVLEVIGISKDLQNYLESNPKYYQSEEHSQLRPGKVIKTPTCSPDTLSMKIAYPPGSEALQRNRIRETLKAERRGISSGIHPLLWCTVLCKNSKFRAGKIVHLQSNSTLNFYSLHMNDC
jgi:hypothetical protein